jgi:hypothetical protein
MLAQPSLNRILAFLTDLLALACGQSAAKIVQLGLELVASLSAIEKAE